MIPAAVYLMQPFNMWLFEQASFDSLLR